MAPIVRGLSVFLLCAGGIFLIALQAKPEGWFLLLASAGTLLFADRKFGKDMFLILLALAILGITPINTDTSVLHILSMGITLGMAVALPYLASRFLYHERAVRFPWHHGRYWYRTEIAYIGVSAIAAYAVLPFYLKSTGAYLHWPSAADQGSLLRLFIGTNGLGIWDELFFVSTVFGILRRHFSFAAANIFQSILFASFLFELGFRSWGYVMIFLFALLQGYIFSKTDSLFYVVTVHLTVDIVLYLALVHAYHPELVPIFISG